MHTSKSLCLSFGYLEYLRICKSSTSTTTCSTNTLLHRQYIHIITYIN